MNKFVWSMLRKFAVLIVGVPLVILGLILIPLPGPGLLVTLAGLFILSLEFKWAERYVLVVKKYLRQITATARKKLDDAKKDDPPAKN